MYPCINVSSPTFHRTLKVLAVLVLGQGHRGEAQEERGEQRGERPHDVMRDGETLTSGLTRGQWGQVSSQDTSRMLPPHGAISLAKLVPVCCESLAVVRGWQQYVASMVMTPL